ncbi:MAG: hypothetical protein CL816_06185 [Coxiellaceae bacterium]|nr:hypothetical protein [Coxiellaceae bacterium]|tara:strand:+ start:101 stop:340 length:240 start_codon:yes stop_codon:yes gene_type:complete
MDTLTRLKTMLSQEFGIEISQIDSQSTIQGNLNLDSVDVISLVASIEIKFNISLNEEDLLPIETLQQLADLIDERTKHG